jgi:hypothetical protein
MVEKVLESNRDIGVLAHNMSILWRIERVVRLVSEAI